MEKTITTILKFVSEANHRLAETNTLRPLLEAWVSKMTALPRVLAVSIRREMKGLSLRNQCQVAYDFHLKRASQTWLSIYDALSCDQKDRPKLLDEYAIASIEWLTHLSAAGLLLKYVKEATTYIAAKGLGQTETNESSYLALIAEISKLGIESPRPGRLLRHGWVAKICKYCLAPRVAAGVNFLVHVHDIAENILYIKRGCPCAEDHEIAANYLKHLETVTKEHRRPDQWIDWVTPLERVIDVVVDRVYGGKTFCPEMHFPSLNACYTTGRKAGGALGVIVPDFQAAYASEQIPNPIRHLGCPQLDSMLELRPGVVKEVYSSTFIQGTLNDFDEFCTGKFRTITEKHANTRAAPFAIPEPCKVRMITMGDPYPYYGALSLQKFLHHTLRRDETFRWIGEPISDISWSSAFDADRLLRTAAGFFVSGDYSAATDNLDPYFSEYAWSSICRAVTYNIPGLSCGPLKDSLWYELGRSCLVDHELKYSRSWVGDTVSNDLDNSDPKSCLRLQRWGQLMGSPMSFPILNIVNASCSILALVLHQDNCTDITDIVSMPLDMLKARISKAIDESGLHTNGDDVVFWCPDADTYATWKTSVGMAGFALSLGKNYTSRNFAIMNSERHAIIRVSGPGGAHFDWSRRRFLNLPLLYGIEAKGTEAGRPKDAYSYLDLAPLAHAFVGYGPLDDRYGRRLDRFLEFNSDVLHRCPAGVIWDAPVSLGGLGLPVIPYHCPPPEYALRRCAYLSCLDTRKRIREVTPPSFASLDNSVDWPNAVKKVIGRNSVSSERIVEHDPLVCDLLPVRLHAPAVDPGALGACLAFLDGPDPDDVLIADGKVITARRELRFAQGVKRQIKRALASSLEPMSLETCRSWNDHRVLQEISVFPKYDLGMRPGLSGIGKEGVEALFLKPRPCTVPKGTVDFDATPLRSGEGFFSVKLSKVYRLPYHTMFSLPDYCRRAGCNLSWECTDLLNT